MGTHDACQEHSSSGLPARRTDSTTPPTDGSVIRLLAFNLEHDGGPDTGDCLPERWQQAHELIASRRPDLLLRQEMTYSRDGHHRRLHAAELALGMRGFLGPAGLGRNPSGLFVRESAFAVHQHVVHQVHPWRTPPTHAVLRLRDVPDVDIIAVSWHAAFNSPRGRERETDEILAIADKINGGRAFIGGGDCNEAPSPSGETVPPIAWDSVTDRLHMNHRTNRDPITGQHTACTYLDDSLTAAGLRDPARHAAHTLDRPDALLATAGHGKSRQGGPCRIDRFYLDPHLIQAVEDVNVIDTTGLSDHHAVEVVLSRTAMARALRRAADNPGGNT
ncbi:endonuclease/exonuclease/phosphatase family protein [Streptomyces sp. NPDC058417]|uniref:endonuclease/exonuclease/phosphatase family protein n=1 Tax=unclassified Streptomyces TaxID=2593676 RepID=UPI0036540CAF